MNKQKYYIALFLIFILSCNNEEKKDVWNNIIIKHNMLNSDLNVGNVDPIYIIDSMLFIPSKNDHEGLFKLFSLSNYQELKSFGSIGRAPNEFHSPSPMIGNEKENQISLLDVNGCKIVTFSVHRTDIGVNVKYFGTKKINEGVRDMYPYLRMTTYNDSLTVGICCKGRNEMFGLLDSNLNVVKYFGDAPITEDLGSAFRINGFVQAKNDVFIYTPVDYQYIACYTIKDMLPKKLWEDNYIINDYTIDRGYVSFEPEARGRLYGMTLGNKYIYLYVNDNKKSEINSLSSENLNPNSVFIYDYAGKQIAKLSLDMRISRGCVSDDERTLYGIAYNPEPALVSFKLPESY